MKEEILALNLLRFLAALGVLFVHKFIYFIEIGYLPKELGFLSSVTQYGYLGVNLFFLISGFVIILSSEGRTFGQFISARFVRLFPVFWICASITSLFIIITSQEDLSVARYIANLTMIPSVFGDFEFIDGSYWTLALELKFYALVAGILLLRTFIKISLEKFAAVATVPLLYDALFYSPYATSFFNTSISGVFHFYYGTYAQYFLAGILFYGIYKNVKSYYQYIALTICYVVAVLQALDAAYPSNAPGVVTLFITGFFGLFLAISLKKVTNNAFTCLGKHNRIILITLGAMTYPLYLLHSKIISLVIDIFSRHNIPNHLAFPLLFFVIVSLVVLANSLDFFIHTAWKRSSILKNLMMKVDIPWLKKVM